MNCKQCGHTIEPSSTICPECGSPASGPAPSGTDESFGAAGKQAAATASPTAGNQNALSSLEPVVKDYVRFVRNNMVEPVRHAQQTRSRDRISGMISMILFCLFWAVAVYKMAGDLFSLFIPSASLWGMFGFEPSFVHHFLRPFFLLLAGAAVTTGALYLACKLMKADRPFMDVVARFGAFMTIPAGLSLLSSLLIVIGMYKLGGLLLLITLFSVGTAISYTVYSLRKESSGGLDPFYGVMATYVATGIALYILGQIIV